MYYLKKKVILNLMATALKFWDCVSHPIFSTWTLLLQSHAIVRHAVCHRFAEMWNLFHKKDVWMKAYDALKPVKKMFGFFLVPIIYYILTSGQMEYMRPQLLMKTWISQLITSLYNCSLRQIGREILGEWSGTSTGLCQIFM